MRTAVITQRPLSLDKNGYSEKDAAKLQRFLDDMNSEPSLVPPEFFTFAISKNLSRPASGKDEALPDTIRRIAAAYLFGEVVQDLGWIDREPNTRVTGRFPNYHLECQSKKTYLYGVFSHPSIEDIRGDVVQCAVGAVVAAGVAALIAGEAGAAAAFRATFQGCLVNKGYAWADQISVDLRTEDRTGSWRRC